MARLDTVECNDHDPVTLLTRNLSQVIALSSSKHCATLSWSAFEGSFGVWRRLEDKYQADLSAWRALPASEQVASRKPESVLSKLLECVQNVGVSCPVHSVGVLLKLCGCGLGPTSTCVCLFVCRALCASA
jgi:hypothetical protein